MDDDIISPKEYAWQLLKYFNISTSPIDPEQICKDIGVDLVYKNFQDIDGVLVQKNGCIKIGVKPYPHYPHRERLTIAHELGHFIMPHHKNEYYSCTIDDTNSYISNNEAEKEAFEFAVELLMPKDIFQKDIKQFPLSLNSIKILSNEIYNTSLTATAINYAKAVGEPIAIVYSKNNYIQWVVRSAYFKHYIEARNPIHPASVAHKYHNNNVVLNGDPELVRSSGWLNKCYSFKLIEETLAFPHLDSTLTVLTYEKF